jgi:predicted transcriptional regulator
MTKHGLELLIERVAAWPEAAQQELVRSLADIEARHAIVYRLSDAEREAVGRGLADVRAGRLASDEAVTALFDRYLA